MGGESVAVVGCTNTPCQSRFDWSTSGWTINRIGRHVYLATTDKSSISEASWTSKQCGWDVSGQFHVFAWKGMWIAADVFSQAAFDWLRAGAEAVLALKSQDCKVQPSDMLFLVLLRAEVALHWFHARVKTRGRWRFVVVSWRNPCVI